MQGAAGEAAVAAGGNRLLAKPKGKGFALLPHPGQEPAQLGHHGGAVSRRDKGVGGAWLAKPIMASHSS